jgi:hypothetical protein
MKALLEAYLEGFLEYAKCVQEQYQLTDKQTIGVINMAVDARLSKLSATFKKVTPIAASFTNIEDGDYIGDIKEMKLGTAKKGRTQVVLEWEVADGEFAGKTQKQFYGLSDDKGNADETGMGYWKNVSEIIGLDLPEDMNLWQETFDEFVANNTSLFDITAKANGQYTNVYVNGVSEFTKGEEGAEGVEEVAAEEVVEEEAAVEEVVEEEIIEEVAKGCS